jgi:hypothetical protein
VRVAEDRTATGEASFAEEKAEVRGVMEGETLRGRLVGETLNGHFVAERREKELSGTAQVSVLRLEDGKQTFLSFGGTIVLTQDDATSP